jgi:hypothetical protein
MAYSHELAGAFAVLWLVMWTVYWFVTFKRQMPSLDVLDPMPAAFWQTSRVTVPGDRTKMTEASNVGVDHRTHKRVEELGRENVRERIAEIYNSIPKTKGVRTMCLFIFDDMPIHADHGLFDSVIRDGLDRTKVGDAPDFPGDSVVSDYLRGHFVIKAGESQRTTVVREHIETVTPPGDQPRPVVDMWIKRGTRRVYTFDPPLSKADVGYLIMRNRICEWTKEDTNMLK